LKIESDAKVPQIICGDFNSVASSSATALFQYGKLNEAILNGEIMWTVPKDADPQHKEFYAIIWNRMMKRRAGFMEVMGSFKNAYANYRNVPKDETKSKAE